MRKVIYRANDENTCANGWREYSHQRELWVQHKPCSQMNSSEIFARFRTAFIRYSQHRQRTYNSATCHPTQSVRDAAEAAANRKTCADFPATWMFSTVSVETQGVVIPGRHSLHSVTLRERCGRAQLQNLEIEKRPFFGNVFLFWMLSWSVRHLFLIFSFSPLSPGHGCKEQLAHGCYATARSQRDSNLRPRGRWSSALTTRISHHPVKFDVTVNI